MIFRRWIIRISIFVITLITFARLVECNFVFWDDSDTILENPRLNPPTWATIKYYWTTAGERESMGLYVPVTYTFWAGLATIDRQPRSDAAGTQPNAKVFHLANVVLHAISAVLVFELLVHLFGNEMAAAIGALLFALHPAQVESVGWASGTKDLLCGLFAIAALLFYVRSVQLKAESTICIRQKGGWRWQYVLGLVFFILAMLSKPTGIVVPMMAWVLCVTLLDCLFRKATVSLLPWFIFMVPCAVWTRAIQPPSWVSSVPGWTSPLVAADALAFYLFKLAWPIHLCLDYGRNPAAIFANNQIYFTWLATMAVGLVIWKFKRTGAVMAAALFFVLPLAPVLGFLQFEFQQISTTADHYLYLPMLGPALLVTWALTRCGSPMKYAAVGIIALLAAGSVFQESNWQNTQVLLEHVLQINPRSGPAYGGLGYLTGRDARQLKDAGHPAEARPFFDRSIGYYKQAIQLSPVDAPSMYNLALNYKETGQLQLGREMAHRIVEVQPLLPIHLRANTFLIANLLEDLGDLQGELAWLQAALRRDSSDLRVAARYQKTMEKLRGPATAQ